MFKTLMPSRAPPRDQAADDELQQGLPFIQAELVTQEAFNYFTCCSRATVATSPRE